MSWSISLIIAFGTIIVWGLFGLLLALAGFDVGEPPIGWMILVWVIIIIVTRFL